MAVGPAGSGSGDGAADPAPRAAAAPSGASPSVRMASAASRPARPAAARPARGHHTDARSAARGVRAQRAGQRFDGGAPRRGPETSLQHADRLDAQPGPLGELLLREAAGSAV